MIFEISISYLLSQMSSVPVQKRRIIYVPRKSIALQYLLLTLAHLTNVVKFNEYDFIKLAGF